MIYYFVINLNERGYFSADVRADSPDGEPVYEIQIDPWTDGDIFTDGFMRHAGDMQGLTRYLESLEIIPPCSQIIDMEKPTNRMLAV